jgi:hypothetical protein
MAYFFIEPNILVCYQSEEIVNFFVSNAVANTLAMLQRALRLDCVYLSISLCYLILYFHSWIS